MKNNKGFTLIEFLIGSAVILIVLILTVFIVVYHFGSAKITECDEVIMPQCINACTKALLDETDVALSQDFISQQEVSEMDDRANVCRMGCSVKYNSCGNLYSKLYKNIIP